MAGKQIVNLRYSKEIKVGDLIAVSYNNSFRLGIFSGTGKTGTIQFYNLDCIEFLLHNKAPIKESRCKYYIIPSTDTRIIQIDPNVLNDKYREVYEKLLKTLNDNK